MNDLNLKYIGVGVIFKFVDKNTNELMVVKFDKESHSIVSADFAKIPEISTEDWEEIK